MSWLEPTARATMEALLNGLWQGLILAAAVWCVLRIKTNAATRYGICFAALMVVVGLPLVNGRLGRGANTVRIQISESGGATKTKKPAGAPTAAQGSRPTKQRGTWPE